jgi:hypothetical protein
MSIPIEVNLRVSSLTIRSADGEKQRVNNQEVRFIKQITVAAVPKAGQMLKLSIRSGQIFEALVGNTKWDDQKERFIAYCGTKLSPDDFSAFAVDPDWTRRDLL